MTAGTDTGSSNTDNITSDTTPDFEVQCTGAGNTITLYVDGAPSGTHTCNGSGTETITSNTIPDGNHQISYTETINGVESPASSPISVEVDTTDPNTPTASTNPNPAKNGDNVTTTVSGVASGDSVSIPGMTCSPNPSTGGDVTCTGTVGQNGLDGTNNTITITDPAGNTNNSADSGLVVSQPSSGGSGSSGSRPRTKEYNCKDSRASNFKNSGIHKQSLCIYEEEEVADNENKKEMVKDKSNNNDSLGEGYACPKNM